MAVGDYISEIQTSDRNTHPIGSSFWVSSETWNGKTNTEVENEIKAKFSNLTEIAWSDLVDLRDNSHLIPGMQYRITDYTCTTSQANTRSAGHIFDIIVTADDERTLNEVARAVKHEGDTYFANSNLSAWKIWYCLDNDINRFDWADTTNGRGVIYRMIDEWNNDIPYDFKNIQFKHPLKVSTYKYYYYTFASSNVEANTDYSLDILKTCHSNTIKEYIISSKRKLNNIIFIGSNCFGNHFDADCYDNFFLDNCRGNSFGSSCYKNSFGSINSYNIFGDFCYSNIFGSTCSYNSFGDFNSSNIFGSYCTYNIFGSYCLDNYFDSNCSNNIFGIYCKGNSFGYGSENNSLGNYSCNNFFQNYCKYNSLGNHCETTAFGYQCCGNSLGNNCTSIRFMTSSGSSSTYCDYYQFNHFGDGCQYIVFKGTETASDTQQVQNYNFAQGVQGTSSSYLTIDGVRGRTYETKVAKNSNGELKIYCEADLIL